ncbi:glutathione-regulated potassium-efflux system oxidoreductase KefF [Noviherbaspirillum galbum]|uniref:NAD(P)H dehydrogenase n=1 Tax=Noviherbaspirillum galbum TaxID=2709383 RepID=A0A6B3SFV6_9BURK|nr:NAD(P)H-dependent oxidoreductase [Noviherbaspirillum galbum]NEX59777.1 NAD(P)H dehydrogenase [Noviherbaspirillum galbum]
MNPTPRILVLYAHPAHHHSHVNRRMFDALRGLPNVTTRDLYECYPDFHVDVALEQSLLAESDLVVLQHPLQWYSMPALMKEYLDVVLEHGWAYGHEGHALRGKDLLLAVTTGGPQASYTSQGYHRRPFSDFLPPYEQTAFLCGMRWHPPVVFHGARLADEAAISRHVQVYVDKLSRYPRWTEEPEQPVPADIAAGEYIHDPEEP